MKKSLIKNLLPPFLIKILKRSGLLNAAVLHWKGDYKSWQHAASESTGYNSSLIVDKVKESLLKVKNGQAAFERDSMLFDTPEYDWPILSSLMFVAAKDGYLNVMDFGGSLGSTYFQNKALLDNLKNVSWNIVEQENFVQCGLENFQDERLHFYFDPESCLKDNTINLVILSSVLPYIAEPYRLLEKMQDLKIQYLLLDKMPLIDSPSDRLTIQYTPASIYKASYPAWFFSEDKFHEFIQNNFKIALEFENDMMINIRSTFKGMLLLKKNT